MTGVRDRPADVEITEEMIQVGVEEFASYDPRFEAREEVVQEIFLAMYAIMQRFKAEKVLRCE